MEHARNVIGIADAAHGEYGDEGTPIVDVLSCSLMGETIQVRITPGSRLAAVYGVTSAAEETTCTYGLNVGFQHLASAGGMQVSAIDATGEVRAVERPDHPFFVATLYQPQRTSTPQRPHPILEAFVRAC